jgi:X-X-X-Leu-X-X-Gly heptad repeat protein
MSGSRRVTSKSKITEQQERVETPEIRSLPSHNQDENQTDDIAAQLYKLELQHKSAMQTSAEAKNATEQTTCRLGKLGEQISRMVNAINQVTNGINTVNAKVATLASNAEHAESASRNYAKPEEESLPKYSFHMKNFLKDPMSLHRSIHSNIKYLQFNGANFTLWERQINNTLDFVFHTNSFLSTNGWLLLNPNHRPSVTILFRSIVDQTLSTATAGAKTPIAIYQIITDCCKRNDRQNKLKLVSRLRDFHSADRQVLNAVFFQEFQEFFVEIQQKHINIEELLGLVLQLIVKPPVLADKNTFRNNLNHRLNTSADIPSFNRVCQEITQVEGELVAGSLSKPISINCIQPRQSNPASAQKGKQANPQQWLYQAGPCAPTNAIAFQIQTTYSNPNGQKGIEM